MQRVALHPMFFADVKTHFKSELKKGWSRQRLQKKTDLGQSAGQIILLSPSFSKLFTLSIVYFRLTIRFESFGDLKQLKSTEQEKLVGEEQ